MTPKSLGAGDLVARDTPTAQAPISATLRATDRCNYDCVHCYQDHSERDELTTAEIEDILEQLADEGVLFLSLMGGEFFMRRDADEIIRIAHELGFAIRLFTTGHHIHDKRADFLATMRPLQVEISLYGSNHALHEQVTVHPGSWKRSVDAAKRLIERQIKVVFKSPMMESNAGDLDALSALADSIGADFQADPKISAKETADQTPVGLRMKAETVANFYRSSGILDDMARVHDASSKQAPLRDLDHTPCRAGQQAITIGPEGDVKACVVLPHAVGNLREQSFKEVWYGSESLDEVRNLTWAKISECNRCALRRYCTRCHGMALSEQGDMFGPSLEACRHAVVARDALRERGVIPATETEMPPTWDRVDADGQHDAKDGPGIRSSALRVLG